MKDFFSEATVVAECVSKERSRHHDEPNGCEVDEGGDNFPDYPGNFCSRMLVLFPNIDVQAFKKSK